MKSNQEAPKTSGAQAQAVAATVQNWTPEQLERAETNRLKALAIQANRQQGLAGTGQAAQGQTKDYQPIASGAKHDLGATDNQETNLPPIKRARLGAVSVEPTTTTIQNWTPEQLERAETNRLKALAIQASKMEAAAASYPNAIAAPNETGANNTARNPYAKISATTNQPEQQGIGATNNRETVLPPQKRARLDTASVTPTKTSGLDWTPEQLARAETNRLKALAIQASQREAAAASYPNAIAAPNETGANNTARNPYAKISATTNQPEQQGIGAPETAAMRTDMALAYYTTDLKTFVSGAEFRKRLNRVDPFRDPADEIVKTEVLFQQPGGEGLVTGSALKHINEPLYNQTLKSEGLPQNFGLTQQLTDDKPAVLVRLNPDVLVSGAVAKKDWAQGADLDSKYDSRDIFIQNRTADGTLAHNFASKDFYERNPLANQAELNERFAKLGIKFNLDQEQQGQNVPVAGASERTAHANTHLTGGTQPVSTPAISQTGAAHLDQGDSATNNEFAATNQNGLNERSRSQERGR